MRVAHSHVPGQAALDCKPWEALKLMQQAARKGHPAREELGG